MDTKQRDQRFVCFSFPNATGQGLLFYSTHLSKHAVGVNVGRTHATCVVITSFPLAECGKAWQVGLQGWKLAKTELEEGRVDLHATCRLPGTRTVTARHEFLTSALQ